MSAVSVSNESGLSVDEPDLVAQADFVMSELGLNPECELSIALVDEQEMARLHEQWMDEPGPTDVLSFPMDDVRVPAGNESAEAGVLGDVIICPAVAQRQADAQGHAFRHELGVLLTHGILHLLGHDHAEPAEHTVMFGLQGQLLASWDAAQSHNSELPGHT